MSNDNELVRKSNEREERNNTEIAKKIAWATQGFDGHEVLNTMMTLFISSVSKENKEMLLNCISQGFDMIHGDQDDE